MYARSLIWTIFLALAHLGIGQSGYLLGDWMQTKKGITQAINNQDYERAVILLQEVIEATEDPAEQAEAYLIYADIATKSGDYEATEFYLGKVQSLVSQHHLVDLEHQLVIEKLNLQILTGNAGEVPSQVTQLLADPSVDRNSHYYYRLLDLTGTALLNEEKYRAAITYFNQSIAGFERMARKVDLSNALQNKAYALIRLSQYDSVNVLLNRSIILAKEAQNSELEIEGILLIGKSYQAQGETDTALIHLDIAQKRLEGLAPNMLETRFILAQFYQELFESLEDYQQALIWYKKARAMKDSLHREDTALRVAFSESTLTIAKQQSQISKNEFLLTIFAIVLVVIAVVVYVQRRNLRFRVQMAKQLLEQNEALQLQRETLVSQKTFIEERSLKLESYLRKMEQLAYSSQVNQGQSQLAFEELCRIVQDALQISRVSIWKFHPDEAAIRCNLMYVQGQVVDHPVVLNQQDYPIYFSAILKKTLIVADDVLSDANTVEFKDNYLKQFGISSMLDVPFLLNGELAGIICCEHTGEKRIWQPEDTIFLRAISDFISVTLLTEKIRAHNEALQDSNVSLEDAVRMRTMELELQNKQLAEYAFINSHLLRAPLAKILGISDIMKNELAHAENKQLLDSMIESADELDQIIKRIGLILHKGDHLTREDVKRMEKNYPVD